VDTLPSGSIEALLSTSPHPAGFLDLRRGDPAWLLAWASAEQQILRAGMTIERLRPAAEFDALFWVRTASPPSYRLSP
jgi:erythromycin esterase-like protein